jgi:hypothetical protein
MWARELLEIRFRKILDQFQVLFKNSFGILV